jgi:hypothetical protein
MEDAMDGGNAGSTAGATIGASTAAAAMVVQAVRASGVLMRLDPAEFLGLLARVKNPLIVAAEGGVFTSKYQYMTSYKGLAFYTKSKTPLDLPHDAELVEARTLWTPA